MIVISYFVDRLSVVILSSPDNNNDYYYVIYNSTNINM